MSTERESLNDAASSLPKPYYSDDFVTIYHGDCRELLDPYSIYPPGAYTDDDSLPDNPFAYDSLVTDPPYGLGRLMHRPDPSGTTQWSKLWGEGAPEWDAETPDPAFIAYLVDTATQAIVWGGNYFGLPSVRGWLIWDKIVREFSSGHAELAWTNLEQPIRTFNYAHGQLASEGKLHPTQKPLPLMRWCIGMTDGVVFDPFMGSGTTLRAAKDLGRKSIGIDREERYCEIAATRMAQEVLDFVTEGDA